MDKAGEKLGNMIGRSFDTKYGKLTLDSVVGDIVYFTKLNKSNKKDLYPVRIDNISLDLAEDYKVEDEYVA